MQKFAQMRMQTRVAIVALALAAAALPAVAGHKTEVDIESLRPELFEQPDGWLLSVRYEVEIEGPPPPEMVFVAHLTDCGQVLADPDGRPFEAAVRLDQPSELDDDEIEFSGCVKLELPAGAIAGTRELRVVGKVLDPRADRLLALASKSPKVHYLPRYTVVEQPVVIEERPVVIERPPVVVVERPAPIVVERHVVLSRPPVVVVERPYIVRPPIVQHGTVIGHRRVVVRTRH